jgi:hypothetical protein
MVPVQAMMLEIAQVLMMVTMMATALSVDKLRT